MLRRNLRLKTWLLVGLAVLLITAGGLVGAVRLLDRAVPGYRAQTADWVSERLGQPLRIGAMELGWTWTGPVLHFDDVALLDREGRRPVLNLRELSLHFGFWDLLRGHREPDGLSLIGGRLTLHRDEQGNWRLSGFGGGETRTVAPANLQRWLDQVHRLRIEDGRVRITDARHPELALNITGVAGTLRNQSPRHRLRVRAQMPPRLGGEVELDIFMLGRLTRPERLEAHSYARAESLNGANLLRMADMGDTTLTGGGGRIEIWSDWRDGRFDGARATLTLTPFGLDEGAESATSLQRPTQVDITARPGPEPDAYRLVLDGLYAGDDRLATEGQFLVRPADRAVEGALRRVPAGFAAEWLRLAAPHRLAGSTADGMLESVRLAAAGRNDWRLETRFSDLRLNDGPTGLRLGRINGTAAIDDGGGRLDLAGGTGTVAVDRYLRGALVLTELRGQVDWRRGERGHELQLRDLLVAAAGTRLEGGGSLRFGGGNAAVADLTFDFASEDMSAAFAHIPQAPDLPNPRLRDWLPDAITAGRVTAGRIRLAGPLDRFPMAEDAGEFRVTAEAEGVELAYKPEWPALSNVAGKITLSGDDLRIQARQGRVLGVPVGPATAHIANVREPVLKLRGEVRDGDAQRMLGFLARSPLRDRFGQLPDILTLDGRADLDLDLGIPLKSDLGKPRVSGDIRVSGLRATHAALPRPLTDVDGQLRFDLDGVYAEAIEGRLAGVPLTASVAPAGGDRLAISARARLRLPEHANALAAFKVPTRILRAGRGESTWQLDMAVGAGARAASLDLRSDLVGMDLDWPAPLGKSAEIPADTRIAVSADRDRVEVDYGERLDLTLRFDAGGLWSGTALFGDGGTAPSDGPGWWLGGDLAKIDVGAWYRAFLAGSGDRGNGATPTLRGADLRIGQLRAAGQQLRDLHLEIVPLIAYSGWRADIDGAAGQGRVSWLRRAGRDRIEARLDRLRLTPAPPGDGAADSSADEPTDPANLPLLDLTVGSLTLAGDDFGQLRLRTTALDDGFSLTDLDVSGGVLTIRGDGEWRRAAGHTEARLQANLEGSGIAPLLRTLGYAANLRTKDAKIDTRLEVAPNPAGLTPDTLNGKLSLTLNNGNLLAVEPGAGRVLGLVNFYALPRRLLLDFRDVLGKGTTFDRLSGDFRIESGNAYTDNLSIDTPSADIRIRGRVGLAARDYDQRVTITPQVSGAAAIAGTVLGGPAVGAALWVAQQFLDKPLGELTEVSYHLTGSWEDPEIDQATATE